jgi:glycosyltransferase involved in cell wall biosynthesis
MQIAIICKTFLKGGAEKQALILAKLLVEEGFDVVLVNWYGEMVDNRNLKFIHDNSLRYYPMSGGYLKKLSKFQKILKHDEISIIISYLTLANFISGISKVCNRNVISIGGIRNEKLPFYKLVIEKLIHNHLNNASVFNNYSAKEKFIRKGFDPDKIYVIQNAITIDTSQSIDRISNGEIKIVTIGRFVEQKDFSTALNAFGNLVARNRDKKFTYYIVGYGPLENSIKSQAEKLNLSQKIKIIINPPDIQEILKKSDIFLSTSLFEGVSNSIMEAMATGLPIVATNVGDNKYLIKNGENGYLVPSRNIDQITDKLEYLAGSEEIRRNFGRNSVKLIEREFSKKKLIDSYLRLFSKLQKS